jgi:thimet oligopeptidase
MTAEEIETKSEKLISDTNARIEKILAINNDSRTFENTVLAYENITADLTDDLYILSFPSYVDPDSKVREASTQARAKLDKFVVDLGMNIDVYKAIQSIADKQQKMTQENQWLLDRIIRNFRRNGLNLDVSTREKIKEIKKEIADIAVKFSQVMNSISDTITFSPEELKGVPQNTLDILKKEDNRYIVGMSYPEIIPIFDYAKNPETRRAVDKIFNNRGVKEQNQERLEKIVQLRAELAELLEYPEFASYMLEIKMAKTPEKVNNFLSDLESKLKPGGKSELKVLTELKNNDLGDKSDKQLNSYDWRYYARLYKEKEYKVDNTKIKKYFPMEKVLESMLKFYQDLLGLLFTPNLDANKWHEDVKVYTVTDSETKELIGQFYLDLFPREGKFGHAAAFNLIKGRYLVNGQYQTTASAMVSNFNKPTPTEPSLLPHSDVTTLFHEFGHLMHQLVTKARYSQFSGTAVSRDFVEVPSSLFEHWMWEPTVLKEVSCHYETGEPLPDDMISSMINAKNVNIAIFLLKQIFLGKYDMTAYTSSSINSKKLWHDLHKETAFMDLTEDTNGAASFEHIIEGYVAGYYGYLWANVYAADLYTKFQEEGLYSKELGKEFRTIVLESGSSRDEEILIEEFLGRKPNNKAYLKSIGL